MRLNLLQQSDDVLARALVQPRRGAVTKVVGYQAAGDPRRHEISERPGAAHFRFVIEGTAPDVPLRDRHRAVPLIRAAAAIGRLVGDPPDFRVCDNLHALPLPDVCILLLYHITKAQFRRKKDFRRERRIFI